MSADRKWKSDPIAVEIHDRIEARLELGQERFGPWRENDNISVEDALEEAIDQVIYGTRLLIKIERMLGAKQQ